MTANVHALAGEITSSYIESATKHLIDAIMSDNETEVQRYLGNVLLKGLSRSVLERFCAEFMGSPVSYSVARDCIAHKKGRDVSVTVSHRVISDEIIQSLCEMDEIAFLWEFDTSRKKPHLVMKRLMFTESDDDVYYMIPWRNRVEDARMDFFLNNVGGLRVGSAKQSLSGHLAFVNAVVKTGYEISQGNGVAGDSEDEDEKDKDQDDDDEYWRQYAEVDVF